MILKVSKYVLQPVENHVLDLGCMVLGYVNDFAKSLKYMYLDPYCKIVF